MSVARCLEINARLRADGITVHEWPGWESRGNGQTSAYEGGVVHHTASPFGPTYQTLVTGRSDLAGPLCNWGGNEDGSLTIVAAHPANHAGASGGKSMGPLPVTTLFNRRVMGLEIVYPGSVPMREAQYRTALRWAKHVADVCGYSDIERIRAHFETSLTGKIDISWSTNPVRSYDMAAFRVAARSNQEITVALTPADGNTLWAAPNPETGGSETHPVAHWVGWGAFHGLYNRGRLIALGPPIARTEAKVDQLLALHSPGGDDADFTEALKRIEERSVEAAERGAREGAKEGASAQVLAALEQLRSALNADDAEQARDGAREVLEQLAAHLNQDQDELPPGSTAYGNPTQPPHGTT